MTALKRFTRIAVCLLGVLAVAAAALTARQQLSTTPQPSKGYFVPAGAGESFRPDDERIEIKINSVQTNGRYSVNQNRYKDPKILSQLRALNDFNPVPQK